MFGRRLSKLDIVVAVLALLAVSLAFERSHRLDIEAPEAAEMAAAPSCREVLENRRFVIRRMLIADGSFALGNAWRSDALSGTCAN